MNRWLWQSVLIPLGKFVSAGRGRRVPVVVLFGLEYAVFGDQFPFFDGPNSAGEWTPIHLVGAHGDLWLGSDGKIRTSGKVVATFDQIEPSKPVYTSPRPGRPL